MSIGTNLILILWMMSLYLHARLIKHYRVSAPLPSEDSGAEVNETQLSL